LLRLRRSCAIVRPGASGPRPTGCIHRKHARAPNARDATLAADRIHPKDASHEDAATITNPIEPELIAPQLGLAA